MSAAEVHNRSVAGIRFPQDRYPLFRTRSFLLHAPYTSFFTEIRHDPVASFQGRGTRRNACLVAAPRQDAYTIRLVDINMLNLELIDT